MEVEAGVTWRSGSLAVLCGEPFLSWGKGWHFKKKAWVSAQLFWTRLQQWELQIWWFLEISCEGQTFVLFNFSQTSKLWSCWSFSSSRLFSLIYLIFHPSSPMLSILKLLFFLIYFSFTCHCPLIFLELPRMFLTAFILFLLWIWELLSLLVEVHIALFFLFFKRTAWLRYNLHTI